MDLLTLRIVNGTIALAFIMIMARLAVVSPTHRYFYAWLVAGFCLLMNSLIGALTAFDQVPYWLYPGLNNIAIAALLAALWVGVHLWLHRPVPTVGLLIWFSAYVLWSFLPPVQQNVTLRLFGTVILLMFIAMHSWRTVWRFAPQSLSRQLFLVAYGFYSLQSVLRAIVFCRELVGVSSGALQTITQYLGLFALTGFALLILAATISCFAMDKWQELHQQAHTDALTGLLNRHGLSPRWQRLLQSARQHQLPVTVAIVDLDHFKALNDRFGHSMGDQVLQWLGQQLKYQFREHDLVVRLGGEEFLLVLPGLDHQTSQQKLTAMQQLIRQHRFSDVPELRLSASIGALVLSADTIKESSFEQWLATADAALYRAKAAGRDQLMFA